MSVGPTEIFVILILALLIFGPKQLPQMGKNLGKGLREFRKAAATARTDLGLDEVAKEINEVKSTVDDLTSSIDPRKLDLTGKSAAPPATDTAGADAKAGPPGATAGASTASSAGSPPAPGDAPAADSGAGDDATSGAADEAASGDTTPS